MLRICRIFALINDKTKKMHITIILFATPSRYTINFYKFFPLYLFDSFFFIFLGNVCNCCTFAATPITYICSLCAAGTPHNLFWGC